MRRRGVTGRSAPASAATPAAQAPAALTTVRVETRPCLVTTAADACRIALDGDGFGIAPERGAAFGRARHEAGHDAVRIDETVGGAEASAEDIVGAHLREEFRDVPGRKQLDILKAEGGLAFVVGAQVIKMRELRRDEKIALAL